jgi:hypothetical protein
VKRTIQTLTVVAGVCLALYARFAEKPVLLWPAMALMVIGVSINYMRGGGRR